MALIDSPINQLLEMSSTFPPFTSRISFLLVEKLKLVVHRQSLVSMFTVFNEISKPLLRTFPMLSITERPPASYANWRDMRRSLDVLVYHSMLPLMRLRRKPKSIPILYSVVFSQVRFLFTIPLG